MSHVYQPNISVKYTLKNETFETTTHLLSHPNYVLISEPFVLTSGAVSRGASAMSEPARVPEQEADGGGWRQCAALHGRRDGPAGHRNLAKAQ